MASLIPAPDPKPIEFYSSAAGGRVSFGVSTDYVVVSSAAESKLLAIQNPVGSGKDVYLDVGEFASNLDTEFRRYSGGTITAIGGAAISTVTPSRVPRNLGGGAATAALKMYIPSEYTASVPGTVTKVAFMEAYATYFTFLHGRLVLRPGATVHWTIDGPISGNLRAAVGFEWWELDALP